MQTILITGGTGLVGKTLADYLLSKGYKVIILTRSIPEDRHKNPDLKFALWDVKKQTIEEAALQQADHIIHLAGAGVVEKKWTEAYKKEIRDSRVNSSKLIIESLKKVSHQVKTIVSASAIGWYGLDKQAGFAFTEEDPPDDSFLGIVCKEWEESIEPAAQLGIRVIKLRTGIVLSNDGGAFEEFKKPIKLGVAGILGSGKQVVSWIHIDDLCRMYLFAIEQKGIAGSFNAVAPLPVDNEELTIKLAKHLKGNFYLPLHVPKFVLSLMMGTRSVEVLKSTTVSCTKIKEKGFSFLYPTVDAALNELCGKQTTATNQP